MAKIAVDIVLLPSEEVANKAIEANNRLLEQYSSQIILDKDNCLPHISLAMGCIDPRDIANIDKIIKIIAGKYNPGLLNIIGTSIGTNSLGEKVSSFEIKQTERLLALHQQVMRRMTPYFSYDVSEKMLFSSPKVCKSTLRWIRNFPEKSAFENFFPHITIGYGEIDDFSFTAEFNASKLALCHLGNHCTCRKVLAAAEFER